MLPAEFSELVAPGGEDTGAGCNDMVWGPLLSLFAYLRLVLHPFLLLSIYSPTPHSKFSGFCVTEYVDLILSCSTLQLR
jgi:hypothetical protein